MRGKSRELEAVKSREHWGKEARISRMRGRRRVNLAAARKLYWKTESGDYEGLDDGSVHRTGMKRRAVKVLRRLK